MVSATTGAQPASFRLLTSATPTGTPLTRPPPLPALPFTARLQQRCAQHDANMTSALNQLTTAAIAITETHAAAREEWGSYFRQVSAAGFLDPLPVLTQPPGDSAPRQHFPPPPRHPAPTAITPPPPTPQPTGVAVGTPCGHPHPPLEAATTAPTPPPPPAATCSAATPMPPASATNKLLAGGGKYAAVPPPTTNAVVVTPLDEKDAATLQAMSEDPEERGGAISTSAVGSLYYSVAGRPQEGIALAAFPYLALHTYHCLIDCGSQLSIINEHDAKLILGEDIDWDDHPPRVQFSPVGGGARPPLASLRPGVLDLVLKYGTKDQTVVRAEWSVLAGSDKQGTPLLGTSIFRKLRMEWHARHPDYPHGGALTYRTAHGETAVLALAYAEPRQLPVTPAAPEPPIEHSQGTAMTP